MADKISGYGRNGVDIASARSRAPVRNERAADGDKAEAASRRDGAENSSQVRLTDTAASLKQVEKRLADLPDVDRKRVETLRQRIESGAYEVNAGRLADRLLAFERDLA
ncbi:MAG: flagellar biosynthesis anti-sigma factor FlgM [Chromatiales bacterium]|nr:flagellar biosynthesis anti-sigma factor FlgM [Chromatiales bacterium]